MAILTEERLKNSLLDQDWEDIEKDLLPPDQRVEYMSKLIEKAKLKFTRRQKILKFWGLIN